MGKIVVVTFYPLLSWCTLKMSAGKIQIYSRNKYLKSAFVFCISKYKNSKNTISMTNEKNGTLK